MLPYPLGKEGADQLHIWMEELFNLHDFVEEAILWLVKRLPVYPKRRKKTLWSILS